MGYSKDHEPIFCKDVKADGAMSVLLKDALKPNLVQTLAIKWCSSIHEDATNSA